MKVDTGHGGDVFGDERAYAISLVATALNRLAENSRVGSAERVKLLLVGYFVGIVMAGIALVMTR